MEYDGRPKTEHVNSPEVGAEAEVFPSLRVTGGTLEGLSVLEGIGEGAVADEGMRSPEMNSTGQLGVIVDENVAPRAGVLSVANPGVETQGLEKVLAEARRVKEKADLSERMASYQKVSREFQAQRMNASEGDF